MEQTAEEIKKLIEEKYQDIYELRSKLNYLEASEYFDMVGKFYKTNGAGIDEYIYVYQVFRSGQDIIIRGLSFFYEETEYWDGSGFGWRTDEDIIIRDIKNPLYKFTEVTRETFENKIQELYETSHKHFKHSLELAINNWTDNERG